jgi:hypothetical protein
MHVLHAHSDKSFVQRILAPERYPLLKNPDGTVSSHSMAWGEADGRFFVYPTVLLQESQNLKRYDAKEAWKRTQATGNFIEFSSAEEAEWFSTHYKKAWDTNE